MGEGVPGESPGWARTQGATVDLGAGKAIDNWGDKDTLTGIENAVGSTMADTLTGSDGANMLNGLAGNGRLDGRGGADMLIGGAGADIFAFASALGGGNVDTLADFVSGTDTIELSRSVFAALGSGALAASSFVQGAAANTSSQRVLYDATTGMLSYLRCRRQRIGCRRGLRPGPAGPGAVGQRPQGGIGAGRRSRRPRLPITAS